MRKRTTAGGAASLKYGNNSRGTRRKSSSIGMPHRGGECNGSDGGGWLSDGKTRIIRGNAVNTAGRRTYGSPHRMCRIQRKRSRWQYAGAGRLRVLFAVVP